MSSRSKPALSADSAGYKWRWTADSRRKKSNHRAVRDRMSRSPLGIARFLSHLAAKNP
jgi:hypothetical protein